MAVVGLGESLEETARMVAPARRGHPELAWGDVGGPVVTLLAFNLGVIALVQPVVVDPLVLRFHASYLLGCTVFVAAALWWASRLGRPMGSALVALYLLYLGLNLVHMWDREGDGVIVQNLRSRAARRRRRAVPDTRLSNC